MAIWNDNDGTDNDGDGVCVYLYYYRSMFTVYNRNYNKMYTHI